MRWILLLCVLAFQASFSLVRINEPILDGRKHWYWDNALFLLKASHSNYHPPDPSRTGEQEPFKFFGTATYDMAEDGEIQGLRFYSHHPVLSPTLFRLYTKVFGYGNWVPRSFMLFLSLATSVLLFLFLRPVVRNDAWSALLTFWYALLPLHFMYMDQWKYEVAANLLLLGCFFIMARLGGWRGWRPLFLVALFLLLQSAWHVYFAAPCLVLILYFRRREPGFERLWFQAALVGAAAVGVNFWILHGLGLDLQEMKDITGYRIQGGMEGVGLEKWLFRQRSFLDMNFGEANLVLYLIGMVYLFLKRGGTSNMAVLGSLVFTFSTLCWVGLFKNLSLVHHYVQWPLGMALVLLVGGLLAEVPPGLLRQDAGRRLAWAVVLPLLALTALSTYKLHEEIRRNTFGTAEDLQAVSSVPGRLLIFSDGRTGPLEWWQSPVIEMARDPIFQGRKVDGTVRRIEEIKKPDPEKDVLVILNTRGAWTSFQEYCYGRFGTTEFRLIRKSPTFSFLRFVAEAQKKARVETLASCF